ncbi:MAG: hypothetical protein BZY79_03730 [SAR202 cluster bacterium Casp-Chloro-G4]|nr:hypothetical protein [Chloroflexota bacterium]MDA1227875.1 hypothetical protein [Chloroflexota bacterium]PKB61483.1 MAG: hypothetical protein BZY79_03730 [SAR202 cluster bacterium Casp-Chloro-G4]
MQIDSKDLERFELGGILGEGADLEVFAATDTQTGASVVVKRPHPTLLERGQHRAVERRTAEAIGIKDRLGEGLPHVAQMLAYTAQESHAGYFGDGIDERYTVLVDARAVGVPLVGSALDGIKRHPIGLPQNLFALHPVNAHPEKGAFTIAGEILAVAEAFHSQGVVLLDLRPQNIFFDPSTACINVIDVGNITEAREATGRHAALDMHDFYLELLKWYVPSVAPPQDAAAYAEPHGMDSVTQFNGDLDLLSRGFAANVSSDGGNEARTMLERIRSRSYSGVGDFRTDLDKLMSSLSDEYQGHAGTPLAEVWQEAAGLMAAPYWSQFLFSPEDMAPFLVQ